MNYLGPFRGHLKIITPCCKQQHKQKKYFKEELADSQAIKYQLIFIYDINQGPSMQINDFWCWWKQSFLVLKLVLTSQHREYNKFLGNTSSMQPTHFPVNKEIEITLPFSQFMTEKKIPWSCIFTMVWNLRASGKAGDSQPCLWSHSIKLWYL